MLFHVIYFFNINDKNKTFTNFSTEFHPFQYIYQSFFKCKK